MYKMYGRIRARHVTVTSRGKKRRAEILKTTSVPADRGNRAQIVRNLACGNSLPFLRVALRREVLVLIHCLAQGFVVNGSPSFFPAY